jgi:small subunit ribosomal protein S14
MNAGVLRDIKARTLVRMAPHECAVLRLIIGILYSQVNRFEVRRRAYLFVARNQTLPAAVRYQAQLQLNKFDKYTRPATVKNRCTATGKARGVMGKFGLCRVRRIFDSSKLQNVDLCPTLVGWQFQFRLKALAGEIPGVKKATW